MVRGLRHLAQHSLISTISVAQRFERHLAGSSVQGLIWPKAGCFGAGFSPEAQGSLCVQVTAGRIHALPALETSRCFASPRTAGECLWRFQSL